MLGTLFGSIPRKKSQLSVHVRNPQSESQRLTLRWSEKYQLCWMDWFYGILWEVSGKHRNTINFAIFFGIQRAPTQRAIWEDVEKSEENWAAAKRCLGRDHHSWRRGLAQQGEPSNELMTFFHESRWRITTELGRSLKEWYSMIQ